MRLLLVEDDEKLARTLARGLRHDAYAVDIAYDGEAALHQAMACDYDCIILDLMLPVRDGLEVSALLRERACWSPILMLTARAGVDSRIRGLDAGADDYLAKPFDYGELSARLRALLRRTPVVRPATIEIDDVRLDPASRKVERAGTAVELTPREFGVLEFLMRRPGTVATRSELLEHVWDANYAGSTNVVDVYVGRLRRKLEQPFGRGFIRTVRGVGFVVAAEA
ncbi:MAG: response regulator transcription factor [Actinomycetota bacterium]|nr:response regulator transcription factor [Actinomycetota bacterium]